MKSAFSRYVDRFDVERHELPYPDNHFDLALAAEIIERMTHDPMWMLLEFRRVPAAGGYLLIATPNMGSITSVARTLHGQENPWIFSASDSRAGRSNRNRPRSRIRRARSR